MVELDDKRHVAELAQTYPALYRVFERLGIDYCCGGQKPLRQACRATGNPPPGRPDGRRAVAAGAVRACYGRLVRHSETGGSACGSSHCRWRVRPGTTRLAISASPLANSTSSSPSRA